MSDVCEIKKCRPSEGYFRQTLVKPKRANIFTKNGNKSCKFSGNYNHFHNILRLFDVLPNFPVTKSEKMGDYYL